MKTSNTELKGISYMRKTGLLYLLVIIFAGFSQGYVRGTIIVPGDAALTAANIQEQISLFRLGLTTDMLAFILDAVISVMLYQIFKPFGKSLAMVMASLRLLAHPAIASLNLINHFLAYKVLGGETFLASFDPAQLETLSLLFTEAHRYGYLIAGAFFGVHLLLLGIFIYRTNVLPNFLGGFILGSSAGYLMETFGNFTIPGNEAWLALVVGVAAAIGELGLTLYLLIAGTTKSYKDDLKTAG